MFKQPENLSDLVRLIAEAWTGRDCPSDKIGQFAYEALGRVLANRGPAGEVGVYDHNKKPCTVSRQTVDKWANGEIKQIYNPSAQVLKGFADEFPKAIWDREIELSRANRVVVAKHIRGCLPGITGIGASRQLLAVTNAPPSSETISGSEDLSESAASPHQFSNTPTSASAQLRFPQSLRLEPSIKGRFRKFCAEEIPYFSREDFGRLQPAASNERRTTEESILRKLENPGETSVFLLQGPGGVGKTRLMLEIGKRLKSAGQNTLYASTSTTPEDVKAALATLEDDEQAYLLFDYVENVQEFAQIADIVGQHNDEALDNRALIIGSLRASQYKRVLKELRNVPSFNEYDAPPESVEEIRLQRLQDGDFEARFHGWLCDQILETHFGIGWEELRSICGETPALAAFLAYTSERSLDDRLASDLRQQDQAQLQVAGSKDFKQWFRKKIKASVHSSSTDSWINDVAQFFVVLPTMLPLSHRHQIVQKQTFDGLLDDGWIEASIEDDGGEHVEIVHDVFVDTAMDVWNEDSLSTQSGRWRKAKELNDTANRALKLGLLPSFVRNLNRSKDPSLDGISSALSEEDRQALNTFVVGIVDENGEQIEATLPLLRASFISLQARFRLAASAIEKRTDIEPINASLLKLLEWAQEHESAIDDADRATVISGLKAWISDETITHHRLIRALSTAPECFYDDLLVRIGEKPGGMESLSLLIIGIRSARRLDDRERSISELSPRVHYCLSVNEQTAQARSLFLEWTSAIQGIDGINDWLITWLTYPDNAKHPKTEVIYRTWLKFGGSPVLIMGPLRQWLDANIRPSAPLVLKAWFAAARAAKIPQQQQADFIEPYIENLEYYCQTPGAARNQTARNAGFEIVFGAPGVPAEVKSRVLTRWLDRQEFFDPNQLNPRAQDVFSAWLYPTRDLEPVRSAVIEFLKAYHQYDPHGFACDAGLQILFLNLLKACQHKEEIAALGAELYTQSYAWFDAQDFSSFFETHHLLQEAIRGGFLDAVSREAGWAWLETTSHRLDPQANDVLHALHVVRQKLSAQELEKLDAFQHEYLDINYLQLDAGEIIADSLELSASADTVAKAERWFGKHYPSQRSLLPAVRILVGATSVETMENFTSSKLYSFLHDYLSNHIIERDFTLNLDNKLMSQIDSSSLSTDAVTESISTRLNNISIDLLPKIIRIKFFLNINNIIFENVIFMRLCSIPDRSFANSYLIGLINRFHSIDIDIGQFQELSYRWADLSTPVGTYDEFHTIVYWMEKKWDIKKIYRFYDVYTAINSDNFDVDVGHAICSWKRVPSDHIDHAWCNKWIELNKEEPRFISFLLAYINSDARKNIPKEFKYIAKRWIIGNAKFLQDNNATKTIRRYGPIFFSNYLDLFGYDRDIIEAVINEELCDRFERQRTYLYFTGAFRAMLRGMRVGPLHIDIDKVLSTAAHFEEIVRNTPGYDAEKDTLRLEFVQSRAALEAELRGGRS